jgi:hypothetical protein
MVLTPLFKLASMKTGLKRVDLSVQFGDGLFKIQRVLNHLFGVLSFGSPGFCSSVEMA